MKKPITFLMLILMSAFCAHSQAFLNFSEKEVRTELYPKKLNLLVLDSKQRVLNHETDYEDKYWYFDAQGVACFLHIIIPKSMARKSGYIEHFNKTYVIVNSRTWKVYANGVVSTIELKKQKDSNQEYFAWAILSEDE